MNFYILVTEVVETKRIYRIQAESKQMAIESSVMLFLDNDGSEIDSKVISQFDAHVILEDTPMPCQVGKF